MRKVRAVVLKVGAVIKCRHGAQAFIRRGVTKSWAVSEVIRELARLPSRDNETHAFSREVIQDVHVVETV